jgi:hypothetical protein
MLGNMDNDSDIISATHIHKAVNGERKRAKAEGGRMMKYVKVLDKDLRPPFQGGRPYKIGVWHHCENFDTSEKECAPGFYVIPVSELIHYHKPWLGTKVLPAEVKGNSKIFSASKR